MIKRIGVVQVFAIVCLCWYQLASAAEQKVFTVLVQNYQELPPYSAYKNNEYLGFNREILDLFATTMGYVGNLRHSR